VHSDVRPVSHWDTYAMHRGGCLELYYCNMVQ